MPLPATAEDIARAVAQGVELLRVTLRRRWLRAETLGLNRQVVKADNAHNFVQILGQEQNQ